MAYTTKIFIIRSPMVLIHVLNSMHISLSLGPNEKITSHLISLFSLIEVSIFSRIQSTSEIVS